MFTAICVVAGLAVGFIAGGKVEDMRWSLHLQTTLRRLNQNNPVIIDMTMVDTGN